MNRHHVAVAVDKPCALNGCRGEHVSVYTDDEQRARDERLISAAFLWPYSYTSDGDRYVDFDAILAAADPPEATR